MQDSENLDLSKLRINQLLKTDESAVIIIFDSGSITSLDAKYYKKGFYLQKESFPIIDSYSNSNDYSVMSSKTNVDGQLCKMVNNPLDYFLLSWTLTQDNGQAVSCVAMTQAVFVPSIRDMASKANAKLTTILDNYTPRVFPNIIYTDLIIDAKPAILSTIINKNTTGKNLSITSITEANDELFSYYPNPVGNILFLSALQPITEIEVYSLLSNKIMTVNPYSKTAELDLSSLIKGIYLLKVTSKEKIKTVRIIKD